MKFHVNFTMYNNNNNMNHILKGKTSNFLYHIKAVRNYMSNQSHKQMESSKCEQKKMINESLGLYSTNKF